MLSELKVGVQLGGDGSSQVARQAKTGEAVIANAHGIYYEPTSRGAVFMVANQSGVTSQAGLSLTTPVMTLFNPKNSGVNGVLIYAGCVTTVAFAAAAVLWVGANTNVAAADVTGTAATAQRCGLLGNGVQSRIQALTAATLPATPIAIATIGAGLTGAITTIPNFPTIGRYFDGTIVIAPGTAISFQTSTASGASACFVEFVWEEVVIV